jgi:hypothetical protein
MTSILLGFYCVMALTVLWLMAIAIALWCVLFVALVAFELGYCVIRFIRRNIQREKDKVGYIDGGS